MKLSKLIQKVGDENVQIQNLDSDCMKMNQGKETAEITFATQRSKVEDMLEWCTGGKTPEYLGLVVWIPRSVAYNEIPTNNN